MKNSSISFGDSRPRCPYRDELVAPVVRLRTSDFCLTRLPGLTRLSSRRLCRPSGSLLSLSAFQLLSLPSLTRSSSRRLCHPRLCRPFRAKMPLFDSGGRASLAPVCVLSPLRGMREGQRPRCLTSFGMMNEKLWYFSFFILISSFFIAA